MKQTSLGTVTEALGGTDSLGLMSVFTGAMDNWIVEGMDAIKQIPNLIHPKLQKRSESMAQIKKALDMSVNLLKNNVLNEYVRLLKTTKEYALSYGYTDAVENISQLENLINPYL